MSKLPDIFDGLSDADIRWSLKHFRKVTVEYGTTLMDEGDVDPSMVCVLDGEVEVRTGDVVLDTVRVGEILGEMALFGDGVRTACVESNTETTLLILDRKGYEAIRDKGVPLARNIELKALSTLTDRLRDIDRRIAHLSEGSEVDEVAPTQGFFTAVRGLFGGGGGKAKTPEIDVPAALASCAIFKGATAEQLAEVAAVLSPQAYLGGHFIITQGSVGHSMYVLAQGEVEVLINTDGDKVEPVATLGAGDAFGISALVDERPRSASCVAKGDVLLLTLAEATWREICDSLDTVGTVVRTAIVRTLIDQLAYANAQLAMLEIQKDRRTRAQMGSLLLARDGLEPRSIYVVGGH